MTEEINQKAETVTAETAEKTEQKSKDQASSRFKPQRRGSNAGKKNFSGRGARGRGPRPEVPAESDYEEKNIEVSRVTRVTKGGKRMRFRVLSVIGNHKGRVGYGLAKGLDVAAATSKATTKARKALLTVPIVKETIPHVVQAKFAAAVVLLKPAPKGTGVKAGGPVRVVLELAGVPNITAKILGSNSKMNNVRATLKALKMLSAPVESKKDQQVKDGQVAEQVIESTK